MCASRRDLYCVAFEAFSLLEHLAWERHGTPDEDDSVVSRQFLAVCGNATHAGGDNAPKHFLVEVDDHLACRDIVHGSPWTHDITNVARANVIASMASFSPMVT